jgi:hypothetical protein
MAREVGNSEGVRGADPVIATPSPADPERVERSPIFLKSPRCIWSGVREQTGAIADVRIVVDLHPLQRFRPSHNDIVRDMNRIMKLDAVT